MRRQLCWLAILPALCSGTAAARVLEVGAGRAYALPSEAAAAAQDGDTVAIAPGTYFDCALWRANGLVIAGAAAETTVITDKVCGGKALFITQGNNITIRNLTLTRARVPDGNGAGIRAEGRNLTVTDSRFVDDQIGILASGANNGPGVGPGDGPGDSHDGDSHDGDSLRIAGCSFTGNGVSLDGQPTHAVLAGRLDLLRIGRSTFEAGRGGDHIASAALRTELVGNRLSDAGGHMTGALVAINGGAVTLDGNTLELVAGGAERPGAALVSGAASAITVRGNTLVEPAGSAPLLRNWTGTAASEDANIVPPGTLAVSESGSAYHRLRSRLATLRDDMRAMAGMARHMAAVLVRRVM
jgi:hypothetical protein